jgi:uncharacterized damage-inducible protein DinB
MSLLPEIKHLLNELKHSYHGPAWYGPAVEEVLDSFDDDDIGLRINGSQSPLELLLHMVQWREYVIRLLEGDHELVTDEEMSYPKVPEAGKYAWTDARIKLDNTQDRLVQLISKFPPEKLEKTIPHRDYKWAHMLHGIVDHDVYHLGQIHFVRKWGRRA